MLILSLSGCATVVLETVLALQSYAISRRDPRRKTWKFDGFCDEGPNSNKITASTNSMCSAVAKLTQWADRVIMDGCVDPTEDYVNQIIDPVRLSVSALASSLVYHSGASKVPRSTSLHNSLPDLASPDHEEAKFEAINKSGSSKQHHSYVEPGSGNAAASGATTYHHRPPPLPPKSKSQSQSDDSIDALSSEAVPANVDWFSNPLFQSNCQRRPKSRGSRNSKKRASSTRTYSESSVDGSVASKSSELDTTLPDFCKPQRMSVCEQTNVSYIDVSPNLSRESFDIESLSQQGQQQLQGGGGGVPPGHGLVPGMGGPLATSSPRPHESYVRSSEPYPDNTSSSTSSDIPPALPRKIRQPPQAPPLPMVSSVNRKISTYDNVCLPGHGATSAGNAGFPTFHVYQRSMTVDEVDRDHLTEGTPLPPPLPPKKKHIMSYMEIFGRSLVTTGKLKKKLLRI